MTIKHDVLAVLNHDDATALEFSVGSVRVTGTLFREVREAIEGDWLRVVTIAQYTRATGVRFPEGTAAVFLTSLDAMIVGPRPAGGPARQDWDQTVIHESFHAACDIHQMRHINRLSEEAIAYLAGMTYLRRSISDDTRRFYNETLSPVFGEAERLVIEHGLARWRAGRPVPQLQRSDIAELRRKIHQAPQYAAIGDADEMPGHDGIWAERWYSDRVLFVP